MSRSSRSATSRSWITSRLRSPDGLLVERPKHVLTVMSHLTSAGIQLPRDVSLISLSHEPFLDNVTPSIAHYEVRWTTFARRLFRMVVQLAETGTPSPSQVLMMADFREGETLGTRV